MRQAFAALLVLTLSTLPAYAQPGVSDPRHPGCVLGEQPYVAVPPPGEGRATLLFFRKAEDPGKAAMQVVSGTHPFCTVTPGSYFWIEVPTGVTSWGIEGVQGGVLLETKPGLTYFLEVRDAAGRDPAKLFVSIPPVFTEIAPGLRRANY